MSDYYSKYLDIIHSEKNKYKGAGFIFYEKNGNDLHFLLGLSNQNKNKQTLSVFGGAREKKDINPLYTAIRETFEELFNIVPPGLDLFLIQIIHPIMPEMVIDVTKRIYGYKNNKTSKRIV